MTLPPVTTLNELPLPDLFDAFAATGLLRRLLEIARDEDLGEHALDLTSASSADQGIAEIRLTARQPMVVAGLAALPLLVDVYDTTLAFDIHTPDGSVLNEPTGIATFRARRSALLAIERPLLNLVGRLSGIATLTRRYVEAVRGSRAGIYDTRKTTPGLRLFEKYAVRCGGGLNHRLALHDAVLVKDNHIAGVPPERLGAFITALADRGEIEGLCW